MTQIGSRFTRCPKSWIQTDGKWAIDLVRDWKWSTKHGQLPYPGGMVAQPGWWIDGVELIDQEIGRLGADNGA